MLLVALTVATSCHRQRIESGNVMMNMHKTRLMAADTCKDPDLTRLSVGQKTTMCDGSIGQGQLVACAADAQQNCVNKNDFKAVNTNTLASDRIARGTIIAGVSGTKRMTKMCRNAAKLNSYDTSYPPSNLPRTFAAANINSGSTDTIDLGILHGLSTDSPVKFTTNALPPELTMGTTYYAIVMSATTIRLAAAPGGAYIDFSADGTGNHTLKDASDGLAAYYDTIDDFAGSDISPWGASYICDSSNFTNISSEVAPTNTMPTNGNKNFTQTWRDELSGIVFSNILYDGTGSTTWAAAILLCESINDGSAGSGWRLPTIKELIQLHIDGVSKLNVAGGTTNTLFSSATTSNNNLRPSVFNLGTGNQDVANRTATSVSVLCVK